MSFKKQMLAIAAVGALSAATAVPAMALENEFHGMFRAFGYMTNAYNGGTVITLAPGAHTNSFAEQRARLQYIAKANDNLKLVTHFELDSRFGGANYTSGKYAGSGDAGQLDADSVQLETKNVYLDFNDPFTATNFKVGVQPWADAYGSTFALFDGAGLVVSNKFGAFTPTFGWFRVNDSSLAGGSAFGGQALVGSAGVVGKTTTDVIVADAKYAVSKDLTVGASYYGVLNDATGGTVTGSAGIPTFRELHMVGLNAAAKFGPAAVNAFGAYQFGEAQAFSKINAWEAGVTGKVKVGPGNFNGAFLYLSGDVNGQGTGNNQKGWQSLAANTTYFNPANMWLLVRSSQSINSSEALGGNFLNKGGRGLLGFFGGYEYAPGKFFANANAGAAFVPVTSKNTAGVEQDNYLGTEVNAQVGYKLYDNLSVSLVAAYLFLGDGANSTVAAERVVGVPDADDPYLTAVQFSYVF